MKAILISASVLLATLGTSASDDFKTGPLINGYGPVAAVPGALGLQADTQFKVSFDLTRSADAGQLNRSIESAARFLNMHVAAGVKADNIELALVFHGPSVFDLTKADAYKARKDGLNANAELVAVLQSHGVRFIVCGQSAAYQGVAKEDLLPGVELALSAMTAHALLQQKGYTLNPF